MQTKNELHKNKERKKEEAILECFDKLGRKHSHITRIIMPTNLCLVLLHEMLDETPEQVLL